MALRAARALFVDDICATDALNTELAVSCAFASYTLRLISVGLVTGTTFRAAFVVIVDDVGLLALHTRTRGRVRRACACDTGGALCVGSFPRRTRCTARALFVDDIRRVARDALGAEA